jgi:bifunctional UDP-N-acetylglucosamine pyrophosphorylase/glucosamine-1-phosphate N-acetyltransferase
MKSAALPKVLHGFAGRSMLEHVLAAVAPLEPAVTAVVVGHRREEVAAHLRAVAPHAVSVVQAEQRGTGHAVRIALNQLAAATAPGPFGNIRPPGDVLILPGDAPLLRTATLRVLLDEHHGAGSAATLLTSLVPDPYGYGRVLRSGDEERVVGVVEHKDADEAQRQIREVSALVYLIDGELLTDAVSRLSTDNAQNEEYLPDVVSILCADGHQVRAVLAPHTETAGVNDRVQLAAAYRVYNDRLLEEHMRAGVTVLDPATTWVDAGVQLEPDVTLLPQCQLSGTSRIGPGAVIGPDSTLIDTTVGPGARVQRTLADHAVIGAAVTVGPFAYLRPGTILADGAHIGTFVEVKNAEVGARSKVPHLSYVGDATIGVGTNIGAATVFVNYDGVAKHRSTVGDHARTGADNMIVAPVTIGDGAYTAAGSVITGNVPPGALGVARAAQRNVAGWVARRRAGTASAAAAAAAVAKPPGAAGEGDNAGRADPVTDPVRQPADEPPA